MSDGEYVYYCETCGRSVELSYPDSPNCGECGERMELSPDHPPMEVEIAYEPAEGDDDRFLLQSGDTINFRDDDDNVTMTLSIEDVRPAGLSR